MELIFTIGPSSVHLLNEIVQAGATGARLTFSYGNVTEQLARANSIKQIGNSIGKKLKTLGELEGPKPRIGYIYRDAKKRDNTIILKKNELVKLSTAGSVFTSDQTERRKSIPVGAEVVGSLQLGDKVVYGDYEARFDVVEVEEDGLVVRTSWDVEVSARRSITVAGSVRPKRKLSYKEMADLKCILSTELFDAVIVTDVDNGEIVRAVNEKIKLSQRNVGCFSRIDRFVEADALSGIIEESDGIIIDRSEIMLNQEFGEMPSIVAQVLEAARNQGKPVILAGQLAGGAVQGWRLSAPELSDLWTHIHSSISGLMLTQETAIYGDPVEAVAALSGLLSVNSEIART